MPEPHRPGWSGRRSLIAVAAAVVVLGGTSVLVRSAGRQHPDAGPGSGRHTSGPSVEALAVATIRRQAGAVDRRNRSLFVGQYDDRSRAARRQAAMVYDNLTAIPVTGFGARYVGVVDPNGTATPGEWAAQVDVSWSMRHVIGAPTTERLRYTFVRRGGRAFVESMAAGPHQRTPVWLLGALDVRRSAHTLVLGLDRARVSRVTTLLRTAQRDVSRVVTRWHGDLVAVVPKSAAEVGALLGARPDSYAGIAALTTAQDGSRQATAVPVIVVNPDEFDRLGPLGARVVISHESTHAATGADASAMPLWLAEGFADYVGIGAAGVPIRTAAARIIRKVRMAGPPSRLPTRAAFGVDRHGLEATYESAWLACRLIAERYGRQRLVAFYTEVERHPDRAEAAFRTALGTTSRRFTEQWRRQLRNLADAG